jgi:hypothetical protein
MGDLLALAAVPDDEDEGTIITVNGEHARDGVPYLANGDAKWRATVERLRINNPYGDAGAESYNCLPKRDQDANSARVVCWIHWDVNDVFLLRKIGHTHEDVGCERSGEVYGDWGYIK